MIGIISDTHEQEEIARKAVAIFNKNNVGLVVHCGDIISPPMLEHFKGLDIKFVFGNNDGERAGLNKKAAELGLEEITDEKEFEFKGKMFYACHGKNREKLAAAVKSNKYDYVLAGHTHVKKDEKSGRTRVINPGALFRAYPCTIALLDAEKDTLEFVEVNK